MSPAIYDEHPELGKRFHGWEPRDCGEHRTVGDYRAWCFDCGEWCYSSVNVMACMGCMMPDSLRELADLREKERDPPPAPVVCNDALIDHESRPR